ncbi:hypothetical protein PUN28_008458 [Cardiocondyla obscurior]|uniref:Uncharacterized protein n=1 Tax=Cardiocondyla obscurior TaxID=286306 RepID=A0AAW2G160_9HYME
MTSFVILRTEISNVSAATSSSLKRAISQLQLGKGPRDNSRTFDGNLNKAASNYLATIEKRRESKSKGKEKKKKSKLLSKHSSKVAFVAFECSLLYPALRSKQIMN